MFPPPVVDNYFQRSDGFSSLLEKSTDVMKGIVPIGGAIYSQGLADISTPTNCDFEQI